MVCGLGVMHVPFMYKIVSNPPGIYLLIKKYTIVYVNILNEIIQ